jgi:ubiquinone/menaquinone biosynthesis C-methylase UbiE
MDIFLGSDTNALKVREKINAECGRHNLEDWIIRRVKPEKGMKVLDIGCGTGKQIFAFLPLISPTGSIVGVDISAEAVTEVMSKARKENIENVKAVKASMDELFGVFIDSKFDLIISTYAIYYSKDMASLLKGLKLLLNSRGHIFISGPGKGTNQEVINLINNIAFDKDLEKIGIDFIDESSIKEIGSCYKE